MGQKKYVQSDVAEGVDFIGGGMKKAETDVFNELKDDDYTIGKIILFFPTSKTMSCCTD